ncbi:MAG: hypothetical protein AB1679_27565 [Actinomycetota bacterium]|jgi:hypothetical protein
MRKQTEGDNRQRRKAAREARDEGRSPSEAGVTTGGSKQTRHVSSGASHDERVEHLGEGKLPSTRPEPDLRPASGHPEQEPR